MSMFGSSVSCEVPLGNPLKLSASLESLLTFKPDSRVIFLYHMGKGDMILAPPGHERFNMSCLTGYVA